MFTILKLKYCNLNIFKVLISLNVTHIHYIASSETLVCTSSRQSTEYENSSQSPAHISSVPTTLRPESRTVPQPHSGSPTASQPAPATCETPRNVCDRSDLPRLRPRPRRLLRFDSSSSSEGDHNDDPTFCPDSYESASD